MKKLRQFALIVLVILSLPANAHILDKNYEITINITDKGFFSDSAEIPAGTTVVWINKGDKPHWPASDLHPTHKRYPGSGIEKCWTPEEINILDACGGLKTNEKYSYKFDKIGNWTLHDHLNPQLSMKIEVTEIPANFIVNLFGLLDNLPFYKIIKNKGVIEESHQPPNERELEKKAKKIFDSCHSTKGPGGTDTLRCYSKEFKNVALKKGSEYAFSVLYELQKIDETAKICHVIAHGIGWGTFERNPDDWQNQAAKINPTCVYGAIHGVLEAYLDSIGSGKLTKDMMLKFCEKNPQPTCIHAVGHLTLVETKDNISESIELCAVFPKEKNKRHYCLTGIFMENMIAENLVQHGVFPLERRIYWYKNFKDFENVCRSNKGENNTACWTEIVHASSINFGEDPVKVLAFCNNAETEGGRKYCRRHAIDDMFPKKNFNLEYFKPVCKIQQPNDTTFERDCYAAILINKLMVFPPEESSDVIDFCSLIGDEFKNMCFSKIGQAFRERYIDEKRIAGLCSRSPLEFRKQCNEGNMSEQSQKEQISETQHVEEEIKKLANPYDGGDEKNIASNLKKECGKSNENNIKKERCYAEKFTDLAFSEGSKFAFKVLRDLQKQDRDALRCHFIAHGIGYGIFKRNPSQSFQAIGSIDTYCAYGAGMGIIERYASTFLKGSLTQRETLLKICENSTTTGCNHVLGHVLLAETKGAINESLESCKVFENMPRRAQCFNGIFMEYVYPTNLISHGIANDSWLNLAERLESLEQLCRSFDGETAVECWSSISRAAVQKFKHDPDKVFEFCNNAPSNEAQLECKLKTVAIFSIENNFDTDSVKKMCDLEPKDKSFKGECYNNLVDSKLDVLGAEAGDDAVKFCSSLEREFRRPCFKVIASRLASENVNATKIAEICNKSPIGFRDDCLGKKNAAK